MIRENNEIFVESITRTTNSSQVPGVEISIHMPEKFDRGGVLFQTSLMDSDFFAYPRRNLVKSTDIGTTDATGTRFILRRRVYFWAKTSEIKLGIQKSKDEMIVFYLKIPRE